MEKLAATAAMKHIKTNKLTYRLNANRKINGAKRLQPIRLSGDGITQSISVIGFSSETYSIMENGGTLIIDIERKGNISFPATVQYRSKDDTAITGTDYDLEAG
jgi:hypothetical protein